MILKQDTNFLKVFTEFRAITIQILKNEMLFFNAVDNWWNTKKYGENLIRNMQSTLSLFVLLRIS